MRIENRLNKSDLSKIREAFADSSIEELELLKEIHLRFVDVEPLTIAPSNNG